MAKGSSSSQASTLGAAGRTGGGTPAGPRQSAPTANGVRRRQVANGTASASPARSSGGNNNNNMFRFYSDDAPGLKITPVRTRRRVWDGRVKDFVISSVGGRPPPLVPYSFRCHKKTDFYFPPWHDRPTCANRSTPI